MKKKEKEEIYVKSEKCVYCGKLLYTENSFGLDSDYTKTSYQNSEDRSSSDEDAPIYVGAGKKFFPLCSLDCKKGAEKYLEDDKKHKKHFYWMFTLCGLFTFGGILFNNSFSTFCGVIIGGLSFLIFPYPVSSFESFTHFPIKKMTLFIRILGILIMVAGVFFLYEVASDKIVISFYQTT